MIRTKQERLLFEVIKRNGTIDIYDLREIFPDSCDWNRRSLACQLIRRGFLKRKRITKSERPRLLTKYSLYLDKRNRERINRILGEELKKTDYRI